ncbi:unnamed protein product [Candida verbasci]|uniref:Golgi apyrase n=1 Tax=Candida verbasci TaxID=1227364 RepID=A0A9W4XM28_9ASCO|nr:unnamed protein product [Candida verbasci]
MKDKKQKLKPGPIYSDDGVPYDYIVIIDAGSKGSRVYIYNWLNPKIALQKGVNLEIFKPLSKRIDKEDEIDSDPESETEVDTKRKTLFPKIQAKRRWHKKITPGISSFNKSPHKIGKHHLSKLLSKASKVVPKSQHYRTPIFLHSTGGMRLLQPPEQQQILDNICKYFQSNSDFFIPDCASHVNVIDGDFEGLYGWLAINSLIGSFDDPDSHKHGKNHTTYGLLDMGGASTQVVFQPNQTEIKEHQNNLYHIILNQVPIKNEKSYDKPETINFNVYSDSFLGFGMFQARTKYFTSLVSSNQENPVTSYWGKTRSPINDPCLPKGVTTSQYINDYSYDFIGESKFEECLTNIFPVLQNSTHGGVKSNCKQSNEYDEVSQCLLNDLIPSFDFDINHFIGVSGYWNAINNLLSQNVEKRNDQKNTYDYKIIFDKTQKVCSKSYQELLELNSQKETKHQLSEDELSELCFKSSWILNFLHLGLGFPRFGIDKPSNNFKTLQLVEELGGSSFSWTLGRALLYANDEYIQAFNNLTNAKLPRPGFYHSPSENLYHYGAENFDVQTRYDFEVPNEDIKYHYFDYEQNQVSDHESKWNIEPHRWYGIIIFVILMIFVGWLMVGSRIRSLALTKIKSAFKKLIRKTPGYNEAKYEVVSQNQDLELNELDKFSIDDEESND